MQIFTIFFFTLFAWITHIFWITAGCVTHMQGFFIWMHSHLLVADKQLLASSAIHTAVWTVEATPQQNSPVQCCAPGRSPPALSGTRHTGRWQTLGSWLEGVWVGRAAGHPEEAEAGHSSGSHWEVMGRGWGPLPETGGILRHKRKMLYCHWNCDHRGISMPQT